MIKNLKIGRFSGITAPEGAVRTRWAQVGMFLWNFIEMLLSMMVGMGIFHVLVIQIPSSSSLAALFQPKTILYDVWMNLAMTISMVAWMIFRKHGWRHSFEMAAASIGPLVVIWTFCLLGSDAPYVHTLLSFTCLVMGLGMLAYMFYRRDHFTEQVHHTAHAGHHVM